MKTKAKKPTITGLKRDLAVANGCKVILEVTVKRLTEQLKLSEQNVRNLIQRIALEQETNMELGKLVNAASDRRDELYAKLAKIEKAKFVNRLKKAFSFVGR